MRQIQWIKGGTGIGRSGAEGGEVLEGWGGGGEVKRMQMGGTSREPVSATFCVTEWWSNDQQLAPAHVFTLTQGQAVTETDSRKQAVQSSFFFFRVVSKTLTLVVHTGLFGRFHGPPNSGVDYGIFYMRMWSFSMRVRTGNFGL